MINIIIPDNNHFERKYTIEILFGEFLGLDFKIQVNSACENYIIELDNKNQLIVEDHFFSMYPEEKSYLNIHNIPDNIQYLENKFVPEKNLPVIFGDSKFEILHDSTRSISVHCGSDVFASAFFMLTRWEEYVNTSRDDLDRFPVNESYAQKNKILHRPLVNEYCEFIYNILKFLGLKQDKQTRRFTPVVTHDVDLILKWYSFYNFIRTITGDILKRKNIVVFLKNIVSFILCKLKLKTDPFNTFDYLMSLSEKKGVKSYFFFMAVDPSKTCRNYNINHRFVKLIIKTIKDRNHGIGFHPDKGTCKNMQQWKKEYDRLISSVEMPVYYGRQHYLEFQVPTTWQIWNDAGMQWDSTLSYASEPGFRCGSCYPFSVFNILTREKLKLKEKPLILMDKSLVMYNKDLDINTLSNIAINLINTVKKYNGEFVLLWHNNCFHVEEWKNFQVLYEEMLNNFEI